VANNQWSPAAVQIGESALSPTALLDYLPGGESRPFFGRRPPIPSKPENLPGVPALFATRLQLELLLQEPAVDLGAVTAVILADPGATIELFRLAGREWMPGEERAERVEDALAVLPLSSCYQVISGTGGQGAGLAGWSAAWEHARRIATGMRRAAELEDIPHPEQAYLVGLLHELGSLPALLDRVVLAPPSSTAAAGHGPRRRLAKPETLGSLLAEEWNFPPFLVRALRDIEEGSPRSPWARLLADAHRLGEEQEGARAGSKAARLARHAHSTPTSPHRSRILSFAASERAAWNQATPTRRRAEVPMQPPA
jgi:HD-like signal output (HDOD) protein